MPHSHDDWGMILQYAESARDAPMSKWLPEAMERIRTWKKEVKHLEWTAAERLSHK
jgi:hypothetical protein